MTDMNQTETAGDDQDTIALQTQFNFYPQLGTEEDENGMVDAKSVFRQVAFGIDDPKILIELALPDEGTDYDAKLEITVGDLKLEELRDVLHLALKSVDAALEQQEN